MPRGHYRYTPGCGRCCEDPAACTFEDDFSTSKTGWNDVYTSTTYAVYLNITATGGSFTLSYAGETTAAMSYGASDGTIETELEALTALNPADVSVGADSDNDHVITFIVANVNKSDVDGMTIDTSSLTGGTATLDIVTTPNFFLSSQQLLLDTPSGKYLRAADDGNRWQSLVRPALNGLIVSVEANISALTHSGSAAPWATSTVGVFIGTGKKFLWRSPNANPSLPGARFISVPCDTDGVSTSTTTTFGTNDTGTGLMKLKITDTSSGAGTYKVEFFVDGVLIRTETSVAITIPDPFHAGIACTDSAAWDNFCVTTNA